MPHTVSDLDNIVPNNKFEKFTADADNRFLQRVPAISGNRESSPPSSSCTADAMDVRLRSGSMSSAYHAEYEESESDSDRDCNAIDMSVIKNAATLQMRERAIERMDIDMPMCGRPRPNGGSSNDNNNNNNNNNLMETGHGPYHHHHHHHHQQQQQQQQQQHHPPPPQLIMRDPHAPREGLRQMTNNSPLSSSASSSPSLFLNVLHESHGGPNGLGGPPLPPYLSPLGQPPAQRLIQQMQHHDGIILSANNSRGRQSSFSSVISSDGAVSPPPHTLPTASIISHPTPLNHHQLSFVPQNIPHELVHKMSSGQKKKLPTPIPKECKDEAYWERRKRNNESAKRSRELHRIKEQQTTLRVLYLEQENLQLRTELGMLRSEVDKLRQLLYVTNKQSSNGRSHQLHQQLHPQPPLTPEQIVGPAATGSPYGLVPRPPSSPPLSRVAPSVELPAGVHHPLPPIATLQQPQRQLRRIFVASGSSRPAVSSTSSPSSSAASSLRVDVSPLSRSPSPQARDSGREISVSPTSSSTDATDLSPLPHRAALTPPAEVGVRPLELDEPASDAATPNRSCHSGRCSPITSVQHPLQPAILRHKKSPAV